MPIDTSHLVLFVVSACALAIAPGPATLYIVTRSISQGRMAGVVSALGIGVGTLFHVVAAALGLSALLMSSAIAFSIVKYLGAVYLIYLGIRQLLNRKSMKSFTIQPQSLKQIFIQGVAVNILNPKAALFFFAFLPQFINPAKGSVITQTIILAASKKWTFRPAIASAI